MDTSYWTETSVDNDSSYSQQATATRDVNVNSYSASHVALHQYYNSLDPLDADTNNVSLPISRTGRVRQLEATQQAYPTIPGPRVIRPAPAPGLNYDYSCQPY